MIPPSLSVASGVTIQVFNPVPEFLEIGPDGILPHPPIFLCRQVAECSRGQQAALAHGATAIERATAGSEELVSGRVRQVQPRQSHQAVVLQGVARSG